MRHSPEVWRLACASLAAGRSAALLYVVESLGSSPGRAGFALTVTADEVAGSIGGGPMEHRFVAQVRLGLGSARDELKRQVHLADDENGSGMICSGEQTVWVHTLDAEDREAVEALAQGAPRGVLRLSAVGIRYDADARLGQRHAYSGGDDWRYEEDLGRRDQLHLVGGGHCSLALSQLAAGLDFAVTVYDDRRGIPTLDANQWATLVHTGYQNVGALIPEGELSFVCVMTFGYKTDDVALRSLLPRDYRFLGALGSRAKIDQLLSVYTAEGMDPARLRRLHAPLGLPIHSQTPAEIAVSIAAQLIRVRNEPPRKEALHG